MSTVVQTLMLASIGTLAVYQFSKFLWSRLNSPLRHLRGPGHALNLDFSGLYAVDSAQQQERWIDKYGHTVVFTGLSGVRILFTTDPKAVTHVMTDDELYPRSEAALAVSRGILGESFLLAEADEHRRQRRFMSPAFGASQVRQLTHVFVDSSIQLRDIWIEKLQGNTNFLCIDILPWMAKAALDGIGLAGFGYDFRGLKDHTSPPNDFAVAQRTLFAVGLQLKGLRVVKAMFPFLSFLRTSDDIKLEEARNVISREGRKLLDRNKKEDPEKERVDLLSTFSKSKVNGQTMSDEELLPQIPTILFAGHDSTGTAASWVFFFLAANPSVQAALRSRILSLQTDNPTMDELNAIRYLDSVVRESLRLRPPTLYLSRTASQDDCIPFSKPIVDEIGRAMDSVHVKKKQMVMIPVHVINRSKEIWGDDAREYKPERWEDPPTLAKELPALWGNLMTFGAGIHACIGYRFALIEIKALVFTLIRSFEFELAIPVDQISSGFFQKPIVPDDPKTNQMPLLVRRIEKD